MAIRHREPEATRRLILNSAVAVFDEIGYGACTLSQVVDKTGLTKGAVYYHFGSKGDLDEAEAAVAAAVARTLNEPLGALERLIRGCLVAADAIDGDLLIRTGMRLSRIAGRHSKAAEDDLAQWMSAVECGLVQAVEEGDARSGLDVGSVATVIGSVMIGAPVIASAVAGRTVVEVAGRFWLDVLPAIASDESRDYWLRFVALRLR